MYTFTPSGNVSNVRFVYVEDTSVPFEAIQSMTAKDDADYSGNISSGIPCKAVVVYKASLNTDLQGKDRNAAVKPELYVIYNDMSDEAGIDRAIKMTVILQDCACCGAATSTGGWLTFMCHNLGADESFDPFTFVQGNPDGSGGTLGHLYQWGRPKDGHQQRNSTVTSTLATNNTATAPADVVGKFILDSVSPHDWLAGGGETARWGDGSTNINMAKADNDPCPPGWKVPSQAQWALIHNNSVTSPNTWTWTDRGYMVGNALFLPAAGYRVRLNTNVLTVGTTGWYWSTSISTIKSYELYFTSGGVSSGSSNDHAHAMSVRCVVDTMY
ncbi:fibrobacter succinogenes major paralogous domain-containing protein [Dysgonomonas reticulitermitis]